MADCVDRSASNGKNGHSNVVSDATSTQLSKRARFQDANEVKNKVAVVLGAQWGDEGKGKVVDMLASSADIVARCQFEIFGREETMPDTRSSSAIRNTISTCYPAG